MTIQTEEGTIDNCFEENILNFDKEEKLSKATDYSAFGNYSRRSMVIDAAIAQLENYRSEANSLLRQAKKQGLNGTFAEKIEEIRETRTFYTTLIKEIKARNPQYNVFSRKPFNMKKIGTKPPHYKAHVNGLVNSAEYARLEK